MIPARFAPILFALLLSGMMSLLATGVALLTGPGTGGGLIRLWLLGTWPLAWAVAFPAVLILSPLTRRLVGMLTT